MHLALDVVERDVKALAKWRQKLQERQGIHAWPCSVGTLRFMSEMAMILHCRWIADRPEQLTAFGALVISLNGEIKDHLGVRRKSKQTLRMGRERVPSSFVSACAY